MPIIETATTFDVPARGGTLAIRLDAVDVTTFTYTDRVVTAPLRSTPAVLSWENYTYSLAQIDAWLLRLTELFGGLGLASSIVRPYGHRLRYRPAPSPSIQLVGTLDEFETEIEVALPSRAVTLQPRAAIAMSSAEFYHVWRDWMVYLTRAVLRT